MTTTHTERRVRIVLEGMARSLSHVPDVLRVRQDNGNVALIDTRAATVEDARGRVWTDGDGVLFAGHRVWLRREGAWVVPGVPEAGRWPDSTVDAALQEAPHRYKILWCQSEGLTAAPDPEPVPIGLGDLDGRGAE